VASDPRDGGDVGAIEKGVLQSNLDVGSGGLPAREFQGCVYGGRAIGQDAGFSWKSG